MAVQTSVVSPGALTGAVILVPMKANDWDASLSVSLLVNFSGNPVTPAIGNVTVQVSNDPQVAINPLTARWNAHDILKNLTADTNDTLAAPVYAVRLVAASMTSGIVQLAVGWQDQL